MAYRFLSTDKRKFIVADTPGHEQYTRNMVTGASTAQVAVILVDSRKGLLTQTRRHSFLASLVGIHHVVLAINKMDLINFDQQRFDAIVASPNTPWYQGPTLLSHLETVQVEGDSRHQPFRLPVQWVNRPHLDFRGFCGTIASGTVRPGDELRVASSGRSSRVARIVTMDGDLPEAVAGQAVTLTLEDEIDISRGDLLSVPDTPPLFTRHPEAQLVWMHDEPLQPGQIYLLKSASSVTPGRVTEVRHAIDVNSLERRQVETLGLNGIGVVRLELDRPVAFDPYRQNRDTSSFILIDRFTNATVAAGMVIDAAPLNVEQATPQNGLTTAGAVPGERIALGEATISGRGVSVVDLSGAGEGIEFDVDPGFLIYLNKGNRVLFRLRELAQMPAVALVAHSHSLSFEFDRTPDGISILLFKRGISPVNGLFDDDGTGI